MPEWFLANMEEKFGFDVPREHGVSSTGAGIQLREKNVDFFLSLGGNYIRAMSDTTALEVGISAT